MAFNYTNSTTTTGYTYITGTWGNSTPDPTKVVRRTAAEVVAAGKVSNIDYPNMAYKEQEKLHERYTLDILNSSDYKLRPKVDGL